MAKSSLAVRATLAILLMVLFYALAAAAVAGLVWLGIHLGASLGEIRGRGVIAIGIVALVCLMAAAVIAWSVLPRWDKFEAPGVEVTAEQHPALFVEIERIAKTTDQQMPVHVYLVPEVNAFVTERGGIMGIGSRRVMGIGLPLMRTLQIEELRAVLAHEMGHFYGGDTKLGPWIYKTRAATMRTMINLSRASGIAAVSDIGGIVMMVIRAPFKGALIGFMRISQAISRAQEYSADAVAVRAEGQRALIDGLKKTHAAALAHSLYMRNEVVPLIEQGKLPEVGQGFSKFLSSKHMSQLLDKVVEAELESGQHDPYDSHPPLRERIEAASQIAGPESTSEGRPAIELVKNAESIELADLEGRIDVPVQRITWADAAAVWIKGWREEVARHRNTLTGISAVQFPTDLRTIYRFASEVLGESTVDAIDDGNARGWWQHFISTALAVQLLDAGYTLLADPGMPYRFVREDREVELFGLVRKRIDGELSEDDWRVHCDTLGLAATLA